jgi:4-diphosphocytidyl-2C-methyl-D-erythritol kinase
VPATWRFLVVCPPVLIPTRAVYDAVDGSGPSARRTPALVASLQAASLSLPASGRELFGNDLEPASRQLFPVLEDAMSRLRRAVPSLTMSGTGSAVFATFARRQDAEAALAAVRQVGFPAWVCRPVPAVA